MLVTLLLLGPGVALACTQIEPLWLTSKQDTRFELIQKVDEKTRKGPLKLRERRSGRIVWSTRPQDLINTRNVLIEPGGARVLVFDRYRGRILLFGERGRQVATGSMEDLLSPSERQRIPKGACYGHLWVGKAWTEGPVFNLLAPVAVPAADRSDLRHIHIRISREGKITRTPALLPPDPEALIRMFRSETSLPGRLRIADELSGHSGASPSQKLALRQFWLEVLRDPKTHRALLPVAVEALGVIGTDEDLQALARLPWGGLERDATLLQVLSSRLPEEGGIYAIRVLEEMHPSQHVRALALLDLLEREGKAAELAEAFIQKDEAFREAGLRLLRHEAITALATRQALPFCTDPDSSVRTRATRSLEDMVMSAEAARPFLLATLEQAEGAGELKGCPEVILMLGALREVQP
jgi:hypothetical protein